MPMANRIRTQREVLNMSQADLARAVGVSQTCVSNWEADLTSPRPANLAALSRALRVPVVHLEDATPVPAAGK